MTTQQATIPQQIKQQTEQQVNLKTVQIQTISETQQATIILEITMSN